MKKFDKDTFYNFITRINIIFITILCNIICAIAPHCTKNKVVLKVFNIIDIISSCLTILLILTTIFPFTEYLEWTYDKLNENEDK